MDILADIDCHQIVTKDRAKRAKTSQIQKTESCDIGRLANGFIWILCQISKRRFLFSTACGGFRPINGFIMGVSTFLSRRR